MPHLKPFGMMNLQYETRICHKIHDKGTTSKCQHKLLPFLSGTDVMYLDSKVIQIGPFVSIQIKQLLLPFIFLISFLKSRFKSHHIFLDI